LSVTSVTREKSELQHQPKRSGAPIAKKSGAHLRIDGSSLVLEKTMETDKAKKRKHLNALRSQRHRGKKGAELTQSNTDAKREKRKDPAYLQREAWFRYESLPRKTARQKSRQASVPKVEADYWRSVL
jgi:hypothetical protein